MRSRDRFSARSRKGVNIIIPEIIDTENLLSDIQGDLRTMLAHRVAGVC